MFFIISVPDIRFIRFNAYCIPGLLISCILSGLVGIAYLGFDPLVRSLILKKLVLSNTSDTFHIWEDPPINPHLKVYFFNMTNPDEVFNGIDKPRLVEVGPYTYRQQWLNAEHNVARQWNNFIQNKKNLFVSVKFFKILEDFHS